MAYPIPRVALHRPSHNDPLRPRKVRHDPNTVLME